MERRKQARFRKRVAVSVDGKAALINNISREGLQISMTGMPAAREVRVRFQVGEETLEVQGIVLWVKKNSFVYQPNLVGIAVSDATPEYERLVSEQHLLQ
jgi:hypothetical protein